MQSSLIYPTSQPLLPQTQSQSRVPQSPKKQQWAIIYNQQAEQYKRLNDMQKVLSREKKQQFKNQLERQLHSKNNVSELEKEEDRRYSDYIKSKIGEEDARERGEKMKKLLERRRIEQENIHRHEAMQENSRAMQPQSNGVSLQIGLKSEQQKIQQRKFLKRELTDALDKQLKMKEYEKLKQRQNDQRVEQANKRYMSEYYQKREMVGPRRKQNEDIYHYFQKLNYEKTVKERELERKLVDEAILKKQYDEARKQDEKKRRKEMAEHQVRQTLETQLQYKSEQNLNEKKYNPQDNSYQILGGIFKEKRTNYDKKQYFDYLARQAEQQSLRKKKLQFMNEQQYRLNMNQLNKAVAGTYEHQRYIDRSVNSIGLNNNNRQKAASSMSMDMGRRSGNTQDDDMQVVKERLEEIRRNSYEKNQSANKSFHL